MNLFKNLSQEEWNELLLAPAYITLLANNEDGELDNNELEAAAHYTHVRTFSSTVDLEEYYQEVEKNFEANVKRLDAKLPNEQEKRQILLQGYLERINKIIDKLEHDTDTRMRDSLHKFSQHAYKIEHSVIEDFIIPFQIKGLTA